MMLLTQEQINKLQDCRIDVLSILAKTGIEINGERAIKVFADRARVSLEDVRQKRKDAIELLSAFMTGYMMGGVLQMFPSLTNEEAFIIQKSCEWLTQFFIMFSLFLPVSIQKNEKAISKELGIMQQAKATFKKSGLSNVVSKK